MAVVVATEWLAAAQLALDLVDCGREELLHLLLLLGLTLSLQVHLGNPKLNVDWLVVAERARFVKGTDSLLAHFNALVQHVRVVESAGILHLKLDANDVSVLGEQLVEVVVTDVGGNEFDEEVAGEILVDILVDCSLGLVSREFVLAPLYVMVHKQV